MKTANQTTQRFPDAFRMILYIAAVAALGFVNCVIVKAGDPVKDNDLASRLEAAIAVQTEPGIILEDWMLSFNDGFLAEVEEEDLAVEDWMLDPASFAAPDYLIVENEEAVEIEDWMLEPSDYVIEHLLIAKSDR